MFSTLEGYIIIHELKYDYRVDGTILHRIQVRDNNNIRLYDINPNLNNDNWVITRLQDDDIDISILAHFTYRLLDMIRNNCTLFQVNSIKSEILGSALFVNAIGFYCLHEEQDHWLACYQIE